MPRNGSGVYSLPAGSIVSDLDTILPAQHNDPLNDIASVLNEARPIVAGGTGGTTVGAARLNLGASGFYATRAAFVSASSALPVGAFATVGNGADAITFYRDGSTTGISDLTGWKPVMLDGVSVSHFATVGAAGDDSAAFQAAHDYLAANGGGNLYIPKGTFLVNSLHFWGDNITLVGAGSGYKSGENAQNDKAKTLATAPTVLRFNGSTGGYIMHRRPKSYYSRFKVAQGGARDILFDGVTGTNKAAIILRDQNTEHSLYYRCVFFGATSRMMDITGMFTGFSTGDNNSAYTRVVDCFFNDKVIKSDGTNAAGAGACMVIGAEFNATNIYLRGVHMVSASSSTPELEIENTDHCHFDNVRCNTGGGVVHADDTGAFGVRTLLRYRDEANGGFAAGDTVTGATSGATATVDEVREGNNGGFGGLMVTGVSGTFAAGENLQVSATTRGVGEDRTLLRFHKRVGTIAAGNTVTGATSSASFVVDEVFLDPDGELSGVLMAAAGSVSGTFVAGENLQVSAVTVAGCSQAQEAIGASSNWAVTRAPSTFARYHVFDRWFGKITFKAALSGSTHTMGHLLNAYPVVDPFAIEMPVVEAGARVRVVADSLPGEFGTQTALPIDYGGQPCNITVTRTTTQSIPNATLTDVSWEAGARDALDAWTSGTDIVVPNGIFWAKAVYNVRFAANSTGIREARVRLNNALPTGSSVRATTALTSPEQTTVNGATGWMAVEAGDIIKLTVEQDSGGNLSIITSDTFLDVEFK